jgi:hypothetical protein
MKIHEASVVADFPDAWGIMPPMLPNGEYIAADDIIVKDDHANTRLVFPVSRPGRRLPLTLFYWQALAATEAGCDALQEIGVEGVWFSPAVSSEGDELWIVRTPVLSDCIDYDRSQFTTHPFYPPGHALAHLSEGIKDLWHLALFRPPVEQYDVFRIAEYPVILFISNRLIDELRERGIEGVGVNSFSRVELTDVTL